MIQEIISEKSKERYNAWWRNEIIDRPLVLTYAPRKGTDNFFEEYKAAPGHLISYVLTKRWKERDFDNDYIVDNMKKLASSSYYAGDAFPMLYLNLGPGCLSSFIGCIPEFKDDTIWYHPSEKNEWEHLNAIEIDQNNKYWQIAKNFAAKATEKNNNNYFINDAGLFSGLDIIASIRGTQQLLLDLIEKPEEVKKFNEFITRAFKYFHDGLYSIISAKQEGMIGFLPIWCNKKSATLQCDFSAMISPQMFEEFVIPELISSAKHIDNVIYHLDGPDAVKHLDILLDIEEIDAIQWVPGKGSPPTSEWIPMLKKIQEKKKSICLHPESIDEGEKLLIELEPEGMLIFINTDSEEEADYLVKRVGELTLEKLRKKQTFISRDSK